MTKKMSRRQNRLKSRRLLQLSTSRSSLGFTLIEVVISLVILSVVVGIVYLALNNIVLTKEILDDRRDSDRIADAIINRISRELQLAFSGIALLIHPDSEKQSQLSSKINLVGIESSLDNGEPGDMISFVALEGGQYLPDGGAHSGVVQITYRVAEDPEDPEAQSRQLLPAVSGAAAHIGEGVGRCHPRGLRARHLDALGRRSGQSHGHDGHFQEPGLAPVRRHRRAGEDVPRTSD